ncbi:uncharacterized protein LOC119904912 [Micropterus salmoides]|uniref:uncharacterized protein LOC119904912 n=1 Tax=Micropterus salmoides TaxID=27706 RepID=UPI0018EC30EF|nr:uncharacterized protein LOC119904912 [Micropterus salmoides]
MNMHHVLLFCFLSAALCGGNNAETLIRTEGGSVTAACHFSLFGRRKFLCKDECKEENILIETDSDVAQRGKYSIKYKEGTFPLSSTVLYVSITQLTKSDSGRYRCGLERRLLPDAYLEFEIRVTDAPKTFPETMKQPEQQQIGETTAAVHGVKGYVLPLIVCVTVVVLHAVIVLLLYKWKTRRNSDGLITRGQSDDRNMEFTTHEKSSPVCRCADSPSPRENETSNQDKIYCNL